VFDFGHSGASGSNVGLAVVRDVAEAHGWSVRVTEAETGGARFEFLTED
jgi:signal transduction histidine kinase